jgi:microcystin-dependent protein
MSTYYYVYPFGQNADDLTTIPTIAAGDGSVSYFAGWTDPYELNLLTDPTALPIPRGQMNQLFFDITNNLQEYQQFGVPNWISAADNLGSSFPYAIYARVRYLDVLYENQVAANTATPGTDSTWIVISGATQGVPVGTIIDFASPTAPTGYLNCNGSAISRTTYAGLLAAISFTQTGTLTNTLNTVTGLSDTSNMYVGMPIEGTNIPASTTVASITSGTSITMSHTATGSGASSIKFFPWGNGNGTTTFNIPDARRRTAMGSGGTASVDPFGVGDNVGQYGGQESHSQTVNELAQHTHGYFNIQVSSTPGGFVPSTGSVNAGATTLPTGNGAAFK